ncbi:MAG: hypothetical protein HC841_06725 [Verrucomicrobiae bacterium]|nr:hypothetical protein [Verrucomicrobiae bacterium]
MDQKQTSKVGQSSTKTKTGANPAAGTFLGVTILKPRFKPQGTTVKKIRDAVRTANSDKSRI